MKNNWAIFFLFFTLSLSSLQQITIDESTKMRLFFNSLSVLSLHVLVYQLWLWIYSMKFHWCSQFNCFSSRLATHFKASHKVNWHIFLIFFHLDFNQQYLHGHGHFGGWKICDLRTCFFHHFLIFREKCYWWCFFDNARAVHHLWPLQSIAHMLKINQFYDIISIQSDWNIKLRISTIQQQSL